MDSTGKFKFGGMQDKYLSTVDKIAIWLTWIVYRTDEGSLLSDHKQKLMKLRLNKDQLF